MTSWLVHGALLLAWVSWGWMAVCIVIEIHSWATGRTPTRLPGSRTMQAMAACLVGTSLAMVSMGATLPTVTQEQRASAFAATPLSPRKLGLQVIDDYGFATLSLDAQVNPRLATSNSQVEKNLSDQPAAESENVQVSPRIHTVSGRETLWSIAEEQLGSARRWRELATLNYSVRQYDGQSLTGSHWIRPGWRLVLPAPSTTNPGPETDSEPVASAIELSGFRTTQRGSTEVGSPTLASGAGGPTDWVGEVQRAGEAPLPLVGAGLLGAGVVSLLSRMRRAQQRRRSEGGLIRLPSPNLEPMERRLRRGGGNDTLRAIDESLKLLRQACIEVGTKVPVVRGIEAHSDEIELVLDRPMDSETVPRPFEIRPGRPSVFIAQEEIPSSPTGSHTPFPTLVTIGDGQDGPQLVNVEAIGSLAVVGDPKDCEDVIRALALEMATSYWAGQFDLVLVGFGNELSRFDRVLSSSDLEMVLHQVHYRRLNGEALLRASSYESFYHARVFEDLDTWDPLIVVCGPGLTSEACAELMNASSDPRNGTATIAPGPGIPTSQIWNVSGQGRSFSNDIFDSPATPQSITPTELADIGE
ncbi:MAG: LysM peptidoglycan-binding domain-containing protein, partial [Acidimicrobiales bacterium]